MTQPLDWNSPHPRVEAAKRDINGRDTGPVLDRFSAEELDGARRLARLHMPNARHDVVGTDPTGLGWRFIRDAVVAQGGKDPGRNHHVTRYASRRARNGDRP